MINPKAVRSGQHVVEERTGDVFIIQYIEVVVYGNAEEKRVGLRRFAKKFISSRELPFEDFIRDYRVAQRHD